MRPEAGSPITSIFALEIDESVNGEQTAGALVGVSAALYEGEDGLVDIDPSGIS